MYLICLLSVICIQSTTTPSSCSGSSPHSTNSGTVSMPEISPDRFSESKFGRTVFQKLLQKRDQFRKLLIITEHKISVVRSDKTFLHQLYKLPEKRYLLWILLDFLIPLTPNLWALHAIYLPVYASSVYFSQKSLC